MDSAALLKGLNAPQVAAVTTTEGPVLVIAGAGSGKTRVITHRIAHLILDKGVAPWEIFAATFTNKAAREMKNRVSVLCGAADTVRLSIATFHSQCAHILRREAKAAGLSERFTICDDSDQTALLRDCINALNHNPKYLTPRSVQEAVSLVKMKLMEGDEAFDLIEEIRGREQADVYKLYEQRLRDSSAVDFDDLLLMVVKLWKENPEILERYRERYRYVMVDEYQDTNLAQFEIVNLLAGGHRNLCVVGDEDQSIYSWRGAEITNLLDFQKNYPEAQVIRLEQNYRSTKKILAAADAVIGRNTQRLGKTLWTDGDEGDPIVVIEGTNDLDEARQIANQVLDLHEGGLPLEDIAVFYRVNALSRIYEDALRQARIPYRVIGGLRFYDRAEIKDLLAYLHIVYNPGNNLAMLRIINTPKRGLGKVALSNMLAYADEHRLSIFEIISDPEHLAGAGIKGKAGAACSVFANQIVNWVQVASGFQLKALMERILDETDYRAALGDPKSLEVLSRLENINEFVGSLGQYQEQQPKSTLGEYLESAALRAADEEAAAEPGVSLMTVHNAKGLEFDVVFIVALEEEIFPNARAVRDQGHSEEERRLFYVALTRARKRVYLTHATARSLYGKMEFPVPSVFIREIPEKLLVSLFEASLKPVQHRSVPKHPEWRQARPEKKGALPTPELAVQPKQHFLHEVLGEVEIVREEGVGRDRRFVVKDLGGAEHMLIAAYADLKPVGNKDVEHEVRTETTGQTEDDDALPF